MTESLPKEQLRRLVADHPGRTSHELAQIAMKQGVISNEFEHQIMLDMLNSSWKCDNPDQSILSVPEKDGDTVRQVWILAMDASQTQAQDWIDAAVRRVEGLEKRSEGDVP